MTPRRFGFKTQLISASALATVLAAGAQAGRLDGRVSDASGSHYLGSAIVRIPELNLETSTGSDGRYSFPNVPEGSYTLVVDYVGADRVSQAIVIGSDDTTQNITLGEDVTPMENVLVYGQSARQASAINQQRANDNITSVITAGDAGNLPDTNIAEALQRAPGVYIERDQGEGRFVGIRGLQPSLNTVKINGVNVAAPDGDQRATALDVIPSALLENLEISKTFTPDMDGDAIGGTIEVKSLSGFDRDGQYFGLTAEGGYNDLVEKWSPKLSGSYSNVFDFGGREDALAIALSLSYEDREFGSDNLEHDDGWVPAEANGNLFPEEPELRDYQITRERIGAAFNIDWRPSDNSEYYLHTLYSDFEDDEIRNRIEIEPDEDEGTIRSASADFDAAEYTRSLKDRVETQEIMSLVLGGLNRRGNWEFDYALGYSYAQEDEPNRHDTDFAGIDDYAMGYTSIGEVPDYYLDVLANTPEFFELDEIVVENNKVEDEELSLVANAAWQTELFSAPTEVKFGGKLRQRSKSRDAEIDIYDDFDGDYTAMDFLGKSPDYDLAPFGFGLDRGRIRSFANTLTDDNKNGDESFTESTVGDYDIDEDIYAGYVMATTDFDNVTVIGGIRYELTEFETSGALGTVYESESLDLEDTGFGTSEQEGDYDYFMPSLLLRWDFSDELVLRAAASQTIARPSFGGINPSSLAEIEESDGETELVIEDLGNPDLEPYEAINLDFSAEYYPAGDLGVVSAGLFYKDLDNYIAQANVADSIDLTPWTSLVGLTPDDIDDAEVLQYVNGETGEVMGLELSWYKHFDAGFLIGLNGTFTDSEASFDGRDVDLPGSASEIGNLILGYENYGFEGRVAVNYKSESLAIVGGDKSEDVYQDEHVQVDASLKYHVTDNVQVYFEAVNITDEPFYLYQNNEAYNWQYEEYGRTYLFGIQVTSF